MQYDLNIPFVAADFTGSLRATVSRSCEFGYDTFAINNIIEAEQIIQKDEKGGKQKASNLITELLQPPPIDEDVILSDFARDLLAVRGRKARFLRRLTIVIRDPDLFVRFTSVAKRVYELYDIVAVQPLTERALQCACERWPIDLIALRLTEPLPFHVQPQRVRAALKRGVYFEVPYGAMLRDAGMRRHVMTNTQLLVSATKSKGIVFSSEAQNAFEVRAADDVAALARMLGMHSHRAPHVTAINCTNTVLHGEMRTHTIRGAMIVKLDNQPGSANETISRALEEPTTAAASHQESAVDLAQSTLAEAVKDVADTDSALEDNSNAAQRIRSILERVERECASRGKRRNKMKYERKRNKTSQRTGASGPAGDGGVTGTADESTAKTSEVAAANEQKRVAGSEAPDTKRKRRN